MSWRPRSVDPVPEDTARVAHAADAVRARGDWKDALSLPLDDAGVEHAVLSKVRGRLVDGEAAHVLLDRFVGQHRARGLVPARGRQRTDSTHALSAVRALSRLELVRETMRNALDVLAARAPTWLQQRAQGEWIGRYRGRGAGGATSARRGDRRQPSRGRSVNPGALRIPVESPRNAKPGQSVRPLA